MNPTKFQNDMSVIRGKDDVFTVLIHLGYLSYNWRKDECWIPNREVASEMVNAVETTNWKHVADALQKSERLLQAPSTETKKPWPMAWRLPTTKIRVS